MGEELRYAIMLMHCGELKVKYVDMDVSFTGSLVEKNGYNLILLNSRLSVEYNFQKLLHEVKHLKHINRLDKQTCEQEATTFENYPVDYSRLVNFID